MTLSLIRIGLKMTDMCFLQMTNDIMQRRGVFGRGLSDIPRGADTAAATPSNLYSSPPPEYTEIEFKVHDPRSFAKIFGAYLADINSSTPE